MTRPFPGMDPYLESHWRDIHHRLITYAADEIQTGLPQDLRARVEERVFVESDLRERLPAISVPLRQGEPDLALDLQRLIEFCYDRGGYEGDLDYARQPDPPLESDDARWADDLLRRAGLRAG